uniref:Aspartyl/asparaginy/proline hydroxylase domain-containing protein n=1 Tax=viral metagenome TaxID=1070528 RepID=A0A6C0B8S4_9ZZZZ
MYGPIIGKIDNIQELISMDILNLYTYELEYDKNKTFHRYWQDLPDLIKDRADIIKNGDIMRTLNWHYNGDIVENIDGMNEIYISAIGSNGSDKVFETAHIDGPFFFLPFCTVLRCIVGIQGSSNIVTCFPYINEEHTIMTNDFLAFDYNRHTHLIYEIGSHQKTNPRILLKLHYLIVPRFIPRPIAQVYKQMHIKYNSFMRTTFLASQKKDSLLAKVVNGGTVFYCWFYNNKDTLASMTGAIFLYMIWK